MAKATVPPTPLTPLGMDEFTEPTLVRRWTRFWHLLRNAAWELWRNRLATMGAVMVLILFLVALLAPFMARYDPVKQNYREMLQGLAPRTTLVPTNSVVTSGHGWCGERSAR